MSLTAWHNAIAGRATTPPRAMHIGDSTTYGTGATNPATKTWTVLFRQSYAARFSGSTAAPTGGWQSGPGGIWYYDNGQVGWTAADHLAAASGNGPAWPSSGDPHLVTIQLGANEMFESDTAATFSANLTTLIGRIRARTTDDPSIVLIINYDENGGRTYPWSAYAAAMNTVAAEQDCTVVDLRATMPRNDYTDGQQPYYGVFDYHPTDAGYAAIAQAVGGALLPGGQWSIFRGGLIEPLVLAGVIRAGVLVPLGA